jgi:hypothetical protein
MIKVFDYIPELDAFVVRKEFSDLMGRLNLTEWHPVVWIGRLFKLDNDYGEHWFDNWDEREDLEDKAKALGYDDIDLMVVVPSVFADHPPRCMNCKKDVERRAVCPHCGDRNLFVGPDGPCHEDVQRKRFWTDVLKSLALSLDTIFEEARYNHLKHAKYSPIPTSNIEQIIEEIRREYG